MDNEEESEENVESEDLEGLQNKDPDFHEVSTIQAASLPKHDSKKGRQIVYAINKFYIHKY